MLLERLRYTANHNGTDECTSARPHEILTRRSSNDILYEFFGMVHPWSPYSAKSCRQDHQRRKSITDIISTGLGPVDAAGQTTPTHQTLGQKNDML